MRRGAWRGKSTEAAGKTAEAGGGKPTPKALEPAKIAEANILRSMMTHLWPKDQPALKLRVVGALGLLLGSKVLNVQVPFFFKAAVDSLGSDPTGTTVTPVLAVFTSIGAMLVGYGLARGGAALFNEARNAVFAKVSIGLSCPLA